jgi:hypothetical protein
MSALFAYFPSGDTPVYGSTVARMLDGVYAQAGCLIHTDPDPNISGGLAMHYLANNPGSRTRRVLPGNRSTIGVSLRLWLPTLPGDPPVYPAPVMFNDGSNFTICYILVTSTGAIQVWKHPASGPEVLVGQTAGPIVTANAWAHLSVKATLGAGATGSFSIEREGVNVLNLTGVDIGAGPCAQVTINPLGSGSGFSTEFYVKDYYIWDGFGTVNNDHPGPVTVYRCPVDADVSSGWARSSGASDFALLDEVPPDDADFISAGISLPAASIMGLKNLPSDVVSVRAIMTMARQRKTDGGDCHTTVSLSPNGATWDDGADNAISTAFTYWMDISELDPVTGLPWTPIGFNGASIKINRTV